MWPHQRNIGTRWWWWKLTALAKGFDSSLLTRWPRGAVGSGVTQDIPQTRSKWKLGQPIRVWRCLRSSPRHVLQNTIRWLRLHAWNQTQRCLRRMVPSSDTFDLIAALPGHAEVTRLKIVLAQHERNSCGIAPDKPILTPCEFWFLMHLFVWLSFSLKWLPSQLLLPRPSYELYKFNNGNVWVTFHLPFFAFYWPMTQQPLE